MPTILQFRRGTTAQNNNYTGSAGEITIDTDLDVVRVHDGSTAGGFPSVGETATQTLTNKTLTSPTLTTPQVNTSLGLKATAELQYFDTDNSNYVGFKAPGTIAANVSWTLPSADATVSGYALVSDSAGALSWAPAGATISQDESTNSGLQLYFASTISGALTSVKYDSGLTYNPFSGTLTTAAVSATNLTGTLQTASQTNITGVGTLTSGTWNASTVPVAYGGTGVTTSTGSGSVVLSASPTFTGTPVAPNAAVNTNTTQVATTAFAVAQIANDAPTKTGTGASGTWSISISGSAASATGNAGTATALQTARAINGVNFDGTSAITVEPYVEQDLSTAATRYLTFVDSSVAGHQRLNLDDTLSYNPSTGTLAATIFSGTATTAQYADLAEKYVADGVYEPGTVMVFGGEKEVTASVLSYETAIAGVVSTNPAYLMNNDLNEENTVDIALVGRVPCKVMGPVKKGTVLVTSEHPGVAMAIDNSKFLPGCIIGRAMEDFNAVGIIQTIEVSVGRS